MSKKKTHHLKTWPKYFKALLDGGKTFELRNNDRNFAVGDILVLKEFKPCRYCDGDGMVSIKIHYRLAGHTQTVGVKACSKCRFKGGTYTGRKVKREVTHILVGPSFGLLKGYCIMSVRPSL